MKGVGPAIGMLVLGLAIGFALGRLTVPRAEPAAVAEAPAVVESDAGLSLSLEDLAGLEDLEDLERLDLGDPDAPAPRPEWRLIERPDEMRGSTTRVACMDSVTELHLPFPYRDAGIALCLRDDPESGHDVYLSTEAQTPCDYYGCRLAVRFDDGEVREWRANASRDGRGLFFVDDAGFARQVLNSARVMIEVDFYGAGNRQVLFDGLDGLEWTVPERRRR